ncbi:MAG: Immunity repressor protein [Bacteroidetes bacterium]|nr:Immunity repressor protein [Bacteroidota bacterium]
MSIATRMRKVREVRGWKQSAVADSMKITQQAYSFMEQGNGSPRVDTLLRFCDVMKVELSFLLAHDVAVTEESVERYGMKTFGTLITEHEKLEQKVEFFNYILKNNTPNKIMEKTSLVAGNMVGADFSKPVYAQR